MMDECINEKEENWVCLRFFWIMKTNRKKEEEISSSHLAVMKNIKLTRFTFSFPFLPLSLSVPTSEQSLNFYIELIRKY